LIFKNAEGASERGTKRSLGVKLQGVGCMVQGSVSCIIWGLGVGVWSRVFLDRECTIERKNQGGGGGKGRGGGMERERGRDSEEERKAVCVCVCA